MVTFALAKLEKDWGSRGRSQPPTETLPSSSGLGLPCMKEQRQPQAVDLIRDLGVEEGEEAADIVHAVHLARQRDGQGQRTAPARVGQGRGGGTWEQRVASSWK